jgi:tRNA G10  N-methylase Trm11
MITGLVIVKRSFMDTYLYNVKYKHFETNLCALEIKALFGCVLNENIVLSNKLVNPSISPYIKNRLQILYKLPKLINIIEQIEKDDIMAENYLVKYIPLIKDDIYLKERKNICKKVGYSINGPYSHSNPKIIYGITYFNNEWYFGILEENNPKWREHNDRPYSYSSSIGINVAKVLLNLGTNGDYSKTIIDPCCGVGTVLLEGYFAGYNICGREINEKVAEHARGNLAHFNYQVNVTTGDIEDIVDRYDVSIVDLPYGNFSNTTKENQTKIIQHAKRISKRVILVSSDDMTEELANASLKILDNCRMFKRKNKKFVRYIWVCE